MNARRTLGWVRRVVLFCAFGALLYAWRRFDVVSLPEGALSPLFGVHPGDRMLIDRQARTTAGEADWLFRDRAGTLLLGRAKAPPAQQALAPDELWIEFDREVQGLSDSRAEGPVPPARRVGRVLLVLPR